MRGDHMMNQALRSRHSKEAKLTSCVRMCYIRQRLRRARASYSLVLFGIASLTENHRRCRSTGRASLPVRPAVRSYPSVRPSIHQAVRSSVRTSVRPFTHPPVSPFVRQSVRPFVRPYIRPSARQSLRTAARASVYLSVHLASPSALDLKHSD